MGGAYHTLQVHMVDQYLNSLGIEPMASSAPCSKSKSKSFIMVTQHDTQQHTCILGGDTGHTHTHSHTHAEEVASEICPLLLTHPGLSFLQGSQEQWAAFMAPGTKPSDHVQCWSGTDRRVILSVLLHVFMLGSFVEETLVNTGRTCTLHPERPGPHASGLNVSSPCCFLLYRKST